MPNGNEDQREDDTAVEAEVPRGARCREPGHREHEWRQRAEKADVDVREGDIDADVADDRRDRRDRLAKRKRHEHNPQQCGRATRPQRQATTFEHQPILGARRLGTLRRR